MTVETVPSPKFHAQLVGVPVDVSKKVTANGIGPVGGLGFVLKLATGGAGAGSETVMLRVATLVPPRFETVKVMVKMPLAA